MTFLHYPYPIEYRQLFDEHIRVPDLTTLAAMKRFALGRHAKWKDCVDLYFILQQHQLPVIIATAEHMFGTEFNEKIVRVQLAFFDDINYSEQVSFRLGFETDEATIKRALEEHRLT